MKNLKRSAGRSTSVIVWFYTGNGLKRSVLVHRTILEKKISKRHVAKNFTDKKPISAFFERIWLLLSKIYFFGSEVKHPAQMLLYRPIHFFFACYTLNGRVIYVLHVFRKQKNIFWTKEAKF